jgi:two-component system alkaline phosphatase synthesis response regulator PhoP
MSQHKILIVDDEDENISYLSTILDDNGFKQVWSAYDGVEGLQKMRDLSPDLVVLDVRMPKKSGVAVFNEMKAEPGLKDIKVIILTGEAEFLKALASLRAQDEGRDLDVDEVTDEVLAQFLVDRPQAFVEKPIEPEAFMLLVRQVLGLS